MFDSLLSENGLSLDRLKNFCLVAEAGGIARVSAGDPAKQSLYSRQIRDLEEFFQVELTRRKGKGIELTQAGQELARQARAQFLALSEFKDSCRQQPLEVRIGAGNSLIEWWLTPQIKKFQKAVPSASWQFQNMRTAGAVKALTDLTLDFALIRKNAVPASLKCHSLGSIDYLLFAPVTFKSRPNSPERILAEYPVALAMGGELSEQFKQACAKAEIKTCIRFTCTSLTQAAGLVEAGVACSVLPGIATSSFDPKKVTAHKLPMMHGYRREIALAWNPRMLSTRPRLLPLQEALKETAGF